MWRVAKELHDYVWCVRCCYRPLLILVGSDASGSDTSIDSQRCHLSRHALRSRGTQVCTLYSRSGDWRQDILGQSELAFLTCSKSDPDNV